MSGRVEMEKTALRIALFIALIAAIVLLCVPDSASSARPVTDSVNDVFARTATQALSREFASPDYSYLLLDLRKNTFVASRWKHSDLAIPVGSLVKPFTAAAYAESHAFRFPEHICTPGACWYPHGHGKLGIVRATAFSCNAYFINLAENVSGAQVTSVSHRFGLIGPGADATAGTMAGCYGAWRESPEALARAYGELLGRRSQPGIRDIVEGMAMSAKQGTASGLATEAPGVNILAKTGTAPCAHQRRAPGDGFVVAAWPADTPHYLLLLRYHGAPGSHAAVVAGRILRTLEPGQ